MGTLGYTDSSDASRLATPSPHGPRFQVEVEDALKEVRETARRHRLWVVVGTSPRPRGRAKPANSLFVIDRGGQIVARYNKRLLTGPRGEEDMAHYRPGTQPLVVELPACAAAS